MQCNHLDKIIVLYKIQNNNFGHNILKTNTETEGKLYIHNKSLGLNPMLTQYQGNNFLIVIDRDNERKTELLKRMKCILLWLICSFHVMVHRS